MRLRLVLVLCVLAGALAATATGAQAATCGIPADDAPRADIAGWMAQGAEAAGLPGELPVMASLVDAGLKNLSLGDTDAVGYFQMRVGIWNEGPYLGFPDHPALQLQWFIDQALVVKAERVAEGDPNFGRDPAQWGDWVADVQRPAEEFRGRYQLRLDEARQLIALAGCAAPVTTTTTIASPANLSITGAPVTYTATVSPVPDGGTVAFTDGTTPITGCGAQPVISTGTATCQVTYTAAGSHTITAAYFGDAAFTASTSAALTQQVAYQVQLQYGTAKASNSGSTVPVKLQ